MKYYKDSDYALNKYSKGIVYCFTDGNVEVTLESFLAENPGMTESDFRVLKELSNSIYFEQDRDENAQTKKNEYYDESEGISLCYAQSPEECFVEAIKAREEAERRQKRLEVVKHALGRLTSIQRKRYVLHVINKLTTREIAERENVSHVAVVYSLKLAENKIKIFLAENKK